MRDPKRLAYTFFGRRRWMIGLFVFVPLLLVALLALGRFLEVPAFSNSSEETSNQEEENAAKEGKPEEIPSSRVPGDPTLYLTVPKLGLYDHTVRNDASEDALSLGAIKLPKTGLPWQMSEDTNTYIACHRVGFPGTESHNQCLDLPSMQEGDEVILKDVSRSRVYRYRVSEVFGVSHNATWVTDPIPGRDVVSLQTCTETPDDWWTIGPGLMESGPGSGRLVVRADRVA